jgi:heme-degrading monooxygenase HmoA
MILEAAPLSVKPGQQAGFEAAFHEAQAIIASMPGYRSHELQRCVERAGQYLLLVRWDSVEAHEVGFRGSPDTSAGANCCITSTIRSRRCCITSWWKET